MEATFSINLYDKDGDIYKTCILIHLDKTIIVLKDKIELDRLIKDLQKIKKEIDQNYR